MLIENVCVVFEVCVGRSKMAHYNIQKSQSLIIFVSVGI